MIVEFTRAGKTYRCSVGADDPPTRFEIVFRPCTLKPPIHLELRYLGRDEIRGIELYEPTREVQPS